MITSKVFKAIGLLWKLNNNLSQSFFTVIYKSFVRPHLDYADAIFYKVYNNSFQQRLESLQYKVSLKITGAIKGFSIEKLYQEQELESTWNRQCFRKISVFYEIIKEESQKY